jgi:hypothetical protein
MTDAQDLVIQVDSVVMVDSMPEDRYDMFSIPFMNDSLNTLAILEKQLGDVDPTRWRSFVIEDTAFVEITERGKMTASPGAAYWLRTKGVSPKFVLDTLVSYPISKPVEIKLQPGWNSIGSPYSFDISWATILDASGISDTSISKLYGFLPDSKTWTDPDTTDRMQEWKGYLVKNYEDTVVTLKVPSLAYSAALSRRLSKAERGPSSWKLEASQFAWKHAHIFAGIAEVSRSTFDSQDQPLPPAPSADLRMYFVHQDWGKYSGAYLADKRGIGDSIYRWPFKVAGLVSNSELMLRKPAIEVEDMKSWLVDRKSGRVLPWDSALTVAIGKDQVRDFEFVLSRTAPKNEGYSIAYSAGSLDMAVRGNEVQWTIPASMGRTYVQIDIIGVDGRTLKTLLPKEMQDEGVYSKALPSGMPKGPGYRIVMRAGSQTITLPMVSPR